MKTKEFGLALPGTAHIEGSDDGKPVYGAISVKISVPFLERMIGRTFKFTSMEVPTVYHGEDHSFTTEPIMLHMEEHTDEQSLS